nr:MAG TPA: hypothetical protein [Caudoviricetes sp.]
MLVRSGRGCACCLYAHSLLHEAEKGTDFARHGVKLYSQCGCDPRKQSAGGKDQR